MFSTILELPVQWGDMDAFGHINNVMYMRYFETARIRYFERMDGFQYFAEAVKPVVVSISGEYKRAVVFPDTLKIYVGVCKLGNASMTMRCEMFSSKTQELAFVGEAVLVMVDLAAQRPQRLSDEMRQFVQNIDKDMVQDLSK
jgi:acyl-CoA thioester hydrolase